MADGLQVRLVASEPQVRQPVCIEFDDRGRLWVIQYLQYPNPAGLKRRTVDRYSRTEYDRVPEPPPRGPRGADRITILEDFDSSGRARKAKDFVDGLNLATGLALGHGGVFVLQAPYLLFYPDRNGDDVPDSNPEVLLTGFGMEDAHSVANSLTWGPDGWLYGCQGSTVTARIRGIEFQQGVWRYHPPLNAPLAKGGMKGGRFELFCEGGGNSWGLDFDPAGQLLYSTNVGGFHMLHGVQGGYYWKSFGKHGALHNPYAYGYFDHVPHRNFRGGHVTVGGIIYQGDSFPERFRGKYIAADLLGHAVYWHDLERSGSSFRSQHGGELLVANDTWFAPSDVTMGPDGAVYVADWHDQRTAHPDPDADWDRSNGRIYRIEAAGARREPPQELARLPSDKLVALLSHPNDWYVRKARRILADRREAAVVPALRTLVLEHKDDHLTLEALWALYVSGGFDDVLASKLLQHRNPDIRRWTVRFLGDENKVAPALAKQLEYLAQHEPEVAVRSQLACTAKRLPAHDALPIVDRLLKHDADLGDPQIPLLLWWAVEQHAVTAREEVLGLATASDARRTPLFRQAILTRLMRRYAAEGTEAGLTACARLLAAAQSKDERRALLPALELGLQDTPAAATGKNMGTLLRNFSTTDPRGAAPEPRAIEAPAMLTRQLAELWTDDTSSDTALIRVMLHFQDSRARQRALQIASEARAPRDNRVEMIRALGELGHPDCVESLVRLIGSAEEAIQLQALAALQRFNRPDIPKALLQRYPTLNGRLKTRAVDVLLSRRMWARILLEAVDRGNIPAKDIAVDQLRPLAWHNDPQLDALVRRHWGTVAAGTPEEKLAEIRRLNNDLRAGVGDPLKGRELFRKQCATCHRLFGDGNVVGPDLTFANRKDRDYLLVSLIDPSAVIRKEYLSYVAQTTDGRLLTGLLVEQTPQQIVLLDAKNERAAVARDKIESLRESPVSLMPDNTLKELKPAELRDLFRYLQGDGP